MSGFLSRGNCVGFVGLFSLWRYRFGLWAECGRNGAWMASGRVTGVWAGCGRSDAKGYSVTSCALRSVGKVNAGDGAPVLFILPRSFRAVIRAGQQYGQASVTSVQAMALRLLDSGEILENGEGVHFAMVVWG